MLPPPSYEALRETVAALRQLVRGEAVPTKYERRDAIELLDALSNILTDPKCLNVSFCIAQSIYRVRNGIGAE